MNFRTTWKEYSAEVEAENQRQLEALRAHRFREDQKEKRWTEILAIMVITASVFGLSVVFYAIFRGH